MAGHRGGVGLMEQSSGTRGDREDRVRSLDCLTDVFRCFLTGSSPGHGAADVAGVILSGLCGPVPGDQSSLDRSCISLTLVDKMSSSLTRSPEDRNLLPAALTSYCREVLEVLVQDLDLMTELVSVFRVQDQILSHLAAKTAASCVLFQLHTSGSVCAVWQQKCVQTFLSSAPGSDLDPDLDPCLWSLTDVLKRLLRGNHQELVMRLLAAVDSGLSALVPRLLPEQTGPHWAPTCCLLLELLELLTASAGPGGAGVCVQRLTHTHCSTLLDTISCCSQSSVRKRALLLLKRAVLQRAGEDWAVGELQPTGSAGSAGSSGSAGSAGSSGSSGSAGSAGSTGSAGQRLSDCDRTLAHSVLAAVDSGWLQRVQVESDSYFGGTRQVRGPEGQRPDRVVLRAVSLVLLKSVELDLQTAGVHGTTQVSGYLQRLQVFLRRCSVPLTGGAHRCSWISRLFSDQDDDMMEAAKALLGIHLHHRRRSGLEAGSACSSGSNPHCHFLLLLQSVSFDHRVLLDFLISTETCFLEYFVRYLKYLRGDAQGFTAACRRISCGGAGVGGTGKGVVHLVDYGSSEDSDPEDMEVCDGAGRGGDVDSGVLPAAGQVSCVTSARALRCLAELREVVTRLRVKKLFPYNPTSLLRLLDQVQTGLITPGTGGHLRDS